MARLTEARQACNQGRILNRIAEQLNGMSAAWGDWDNYFQNKLDELRLATKDLQGQMEEYVAERKRGAK